MTPQTGRIRWHKSSRSGGTGGNCIELANTLHTVRDSKNPHGPSLSADLLQFVQAIKDGRL